MKKLIAAMLCAASFTVQAAQTLKAEVHGMVCAFCAQGIEKKLRALSQTQDVYVNLKDKVVAVEVRDGQTLAPQTVKDLVKDAGYDVVAIETVSMSAKQLREGGAK